MSSEHGKEPKKGIAFVLMGISAPILGSALSYLVSLLMNGVRDAVLNITDPSIHCELINHVSFTIQAFSNTNEILDYRSGKVISWESLPYKNVSEWTGYCNNFKNYFIAFWIVLLLALVIWMLLKQQIPDYFKAIAIAVPIYLSLLNGFFFLFGLLVVIGLIIYFIRFKKPWYFYFSTAIYLAASLFIWTLRSFA